MFPISECKTTFRIIRDLISHCKQTKHNRLKCEQCCQTFSEIEALKSHVATLHSDATKEKTPPKVECDECGKRFKWASKLQRHMQVRKGSFINAHTCKIWISLVSDRTYLIILYMMNVPPLPLSPVQFQYNFLLL